MWICYSNIQQKFQLGDIDILCSPEKKFILMISSITSYSNSIYVDLVQKIWLKFDISIEK